ncbi:MAG TPA: GNAT family N-acetyltransferase [Mycobacterium sp.]|nr:GNAT family N-acetyltransferase [Mycobacterium sp.]
MSDPTVSAADRQYEISVDGVRAGFAAYVDSAGQRIFHHTVIDEAFGGRGLGTELIGAALADTRAAGKRIVPVCSFVEAYLAKHPEYADVVDPVTEQVRQTLVAHQD